jgi:hypothetical protein
VNGLLIGKVGAVLAVAGGSAGITWAATGSGSDVITSAGPAAWIDDPLDGSVLPGDAGQVTVVAHATDPDGIVEIVLTVDGDDVDSTGTGGGDLETADDLRWTPRGPGTYELRVFGRDPSGATTPPGIAKVQVGTDEEQPATTTTTTGPADSTSSTDVALDSTTTAPGAPTTRPVTGTTTATTQPTTTTSTTAPPTTTCVLATPLNVTPTFGGTKTPTLEWTYDGCAADQFRLQLSRDEAFYPTRIEVEGTAPGTDRRWITPELQCDITYWFRVRAEAGRSFGAWSAPTSFTVSFRTCA